MPDSSTESMTANSEWNNYREGQEDNEGRKIDKLFSKTPSYVIYFNGLDLLYKIGLELQGHLGLAKLGSADAALARINRLLDKTKTKGREYRFNRSILELAADALEMAFSDETAEAGEILKGIQDKLEAKEEGQRRLMYQAGTLVIALVVWFAYLLLRGWTLPPEWDPWMLAAALAMAGGLFSVCLNVGELQVNVNQQNWFLLSAGATRAVVALLAGIGLLLATRSKIFAGIAYPKEPPTPGALLTIAEMFFCFLAGFSEYFVPNILSKAAADKADEGKRKQIDIDKNKKSEEVQSKDELNKNKGVGAQ